MLRGLWVLLRRRIDSPATAAPSISLDLDGGLDWLCVDCTDVDQFIPTRILLILSIYMSVILSMFCKALQCPAVKVGLPWIVG